MHPRRSRYLRGRLQQLVATLMLLKGILRRHVKPVTEEGFLTSQLPRRLIWSSFLGDDGSQDGRHPSWVFDMKIGKQTIKGKNLGGKRGGFISFRLLTRNWSQPRGLGSLHFQCKDSLCSTPPFLVNTMTFCLSPWTSAPGGSASFSLGCFFFPAPLHCLLH